MPADFQTGNGRFKFGIESHEAIAQTLEMIAAGIRSGDVITQKWTEATIRKTDDFGEYGLEILFCKKEPA